MKWADEQLLSALGTAPAQVPEPISLTIHQIYAAEVSWLQRVLGKPHPSTGVDTAADPARMRSLWIGIHEAWLDWAESMQDDADWERIVLPAGGEGDFLELSAWQVALHVVDRGTHFRGQAALQMEQAGITPADMELITFYREG